LKHPRILELAIITSHGYSGISMAERLVVVKGLFVFQEIKTVFVE